MQYNIIEFPFLSDLLFRYFKTVAYLKCSLVGEVNWAKMSEESSSDRKFIRGEKGKY